MNLGPLFEGGGAAEEGRCPVCGAGVVRGGLAAHLNGECYGPGGGEVETPRLGAGWGPPPEIRPPLTLMNRLALPRLRTPDPGREPELPALPLHTNGAAAPTPLGVEATPATSAGRDVSGVEEGGDEPQDWDSPIGEFISQKEEPAGGEGELGLAAGLGSPPRALLDLQEPEVLAPPSQERCSPPSLSDSEAPGGSGGFDFSIRCSQLYERVDAEEEASPSPEAYRAPASPEPGPVRELEMARTPELMLAGGDGGRGPTATCATPPLYSIFLPKSERKRVLVVRHGESQFNAADAHGTSWSDPNIFDAPLTARGHAQARALREQMLAFRDALWVTSPLSRAMQTCLDACPWRTPTGEPELPAVMVRPEIAEHCATSGDVGRPRAALIQDFPLLADQLRHLPDVWWWSPPGRPNNSELKQFSSAESRARMATRVEAFRAWVLRRPEQTIVAFGHSTFWKYFLGKQNEKRLKNCEVFTAYF